MRRLSALGILLATAWTCGLGVAPVSAQILRIVPNKVLVDEPATIRGTGLRPGERVTIRSELIDGNGHPWAAQAQFLADAKGQVDTSKQAPVKGSYHEISAMGLVWSMKPMAKHVSIYRSARKLGPQMIEFHLLREGQTVASAQLEQLHVADGVRQLRVGGPIHGVLFVPGDSSRHPGILVVGGSEGGLPLLRAAWLASHGFVALALAYFRYDGLPRKLEGIPLEYFGEALSWMVKQPEIIPDRIGVMGTSRGGELALQLGSMYSVIKAVVAYVPANVRYPACCGHTDVPYAWTWHGRPLPYDATPRVFWPSAAAMRAVIPVERTDGPILLVAGEDDSLWPSPIMAAAVAERLKEFHFRYPVVYLKYPHAGHLAGRPEIVPTWHGGFENPMSGREVELGGNAKGDAQSSLDAIPKVLAFLHSSLMASASPR